MSRFGVVVAFIFAVVFLCTASWFITGAKSQALQRCAPYKVMASKLRHYNEHPTAIAVANTAAVELWKEPTGKTWTFIAIDVNNSACIIASGFNWTFHMLVLPGEKV